MSLERARTGKVPAQLRPEVDMSAAYFRAGVHTYTRYEPYGVVGVITPWNLPLNQACRALGPALARGNAVVVTLPFRGEAEALTLANDSPCGLVAVVWSGDLARGLRLAEAIEAGQVGVNGGPLTIETPFGGYRRSGHGREKCLAALHEYAQLKTVSAALR
ncbi:aldehyde dehydrogenase family protein [Streptomyces sp. UG1]|uniref:aldehyde dehydrogenase family protein n=1 Tax=Streptomyces sp. UG1 TaxID=3417652 RepID=UPI003CE6A77D